MAVRWRQDSQVYRKYLQSIVALYQSRQDIRLFTEMLLSLTTIVIFGLFAIRPTLVTIAQLINEQRTKQEIISIMDQKIEGLVSAQSLYETERERLELLETAIPARPEPDHYIRHIEGISQKNNVTLMALVIEPVTLAGGEQEEPPTGVGSLTPETSPSLTASITARGSYANLLTFLADLEAMRRPLYAESVKIAIVEGSQIVEIQVTAKGKVPYYPETIDNTQ